MTATDPSDVAIVRLLNTDDGAFGVHTLTATYALDLDRRRLLRMPRHPRPGEPRLPAGTFVFRFDGLDGNWLPLVRLEVCEIGAAMQMHALINGVEQPWRTTEVQGIERMRPAPECNSER